MLLCFFSMFFWTGDIEPVFFCGGCGGVDGFSFLGVFCWA